MAPRCIVVGGGLAGLMTTLKLCEAGYAVDLFSIVPVRRSHSVCARAGINGAVNPAAAGDAPGVHFCDTVTGGDFLANQPLVKGMCEAAPAILSLLDRMGVPFTRTPEGHVDFRRLGGSRFARAAFVGASTGQQLLYALDEQVRRYEAEGLVETYELWDFCSAVLDGEGVCRGIVAQNLRTMEMGAFPADAVALATGGNGFLYGKSTLSMVCDGAAASAAYQQGACYANGEFIQIHPTTIPGPDKLRAMSEAVRGEGGRVWVPRDGRPWYFLEERYPSSGGLVPADIAAREIFHVCRVLKLGVDGQDLVYLDVSHLPRGTLDGRLDGFLDTYETFAGHDPRTVPMRVFPGVHASLGGLWIDYEADAQGNPVGGSPRNHQTTIPGLFAVGDVEYAYHGANRLGGNSTLAALYGGTLCGPAMVAYARGLERGAAAVPAAVFEDERRRQQAMVDRIAGLEGGENPYQIHQDLGERMTAHATVVRHNDQLKATYDALGEFQERWRRMEITDAARWTNQVIPFARHLWNMLELAKVIVLGALRRDESRGAHYKPEFPDRNDARWLKTTRAKWSPEGPVLSYDPVDTSLLPPAERAY